MLNDLWTQVLAWSGALVAPDWGALVALIPLLLLLAVAAFVVITGAKWAAVVPSRGPNAGRRLPVGGDGRPLRSPAVGPMVLAVGVFALAVGLLTGAAWLFAGAIAAAAGVGIWAVEVRDGPGLRLLHLSRWRLAALVAIAVLVAVLVATARVEPDVPRGSTNALAPGAAPSSAMPAADATLVARGIAFAESTLAAPAGRRFSVAFDNRDSVPHNLEIRDADGSVVFRGDIVTGPVVKVYDVPPLPAGAYQFVCTVHPAMAGTLTVK